MKDIITIDGPSGAGKSTVARLLAQRLGYTYLDTGALYRAVAWKVKKEDIDPEDEKALEHILEKITITVKEGKILINATDVSSHIRTPDIGELSSRLSAKPVIRRYLFTIQREVGLKGRVVIEGRDIGTVIFPEAENKFFLDASPEERGRRRYNELKGKHLQMSLEETINRIKARDERDSTRQDSPLKKTDDMVYIDTTNLGVEEVILRIIEALKTA